MSEYAQSANILSIAEDGDYKGFLIQISETGPNLTAAIKNEGGEKAVAKFVQIIDSRINNMDFDNIFDAVDKMHKEFGTIPKRNLNAQRVVTCKTGQGYVFKWTPE